MDIEERLSIFASELEALRTVGCGRWIFPVTLKRKVIDLCQAGVSRKVLFDRFGIYSSQVSLWKRQLYSIPEKSSELSYSIREIPIVSCQEAEQRKSHVRRPKLYIRIFSLRISWF